MRLCVMASWRGSNFKAIVDHVRLGVLRGVEVPLLIYTDEGAPVSGIARDYGVDVPRWRGRVRYWSCSGRTT